MKTQTRPPSSTCPHCGASMKEFWHNLTPGLVNNLIKFIEAVKSKGENEIHLQKDLDFTKNEYNNFQKLRYWGLVHHADKDNTHSGKWLITRQGGEFLRNELAVPKRIKTFRNQIVEKGEEFVKISDFFPHRRVDFWQENYDFDIHQSKII